MSRLELEGSVRADKMRRETTISTRDLNYMKACLRAHRERLRDAADTLSNYGVYDDHPDAISIREYLAETEDVERLIK